MGAPDDPYDAGTLGDRADAVKGKASGALGSAQDRAAGALDTVSDAPAQVQRKARGNPLAAGLIAFGIGYLISSAIPSSEKEQQAASRLQEKAAPLKEKVSEAAGDLADRLREPAQEAAASVKSAATDAVANVKDEGQQPGTTSRARSATPPPRSRTARRPDLPICAGGFGVRRSGPAGALTSRRRHLPPDLVPVSARSTTSARWSDSGSLTARLPTTRPTWPRAST